MRLYNAANLYAARLPHPLSVRPTSNKSVLILMVWKSTLKMCPKTINQSKSISCGVSRHEQKHLNWKKIGFRCEQ
jgi:hypothetical protein